MTKIVKLLTLFSMFCTTAMAQTLESPSGELKLDFKLNEKATPTYTLKYKGRDVIEPSRLGFVVRGIAPLTEGFEITETATNSHNETWQPVLGERSHIVDHHNELLVKLRHPKTTAEVWIRFRAFDDGVGFRYEFPKQAYLNHFLIDDETTQFQLTGDHKAFWLPYDYDTNEYPTTTSKLSEVANLMGDVRNEGLAAKAYDPEVLGVQTPLMLKSDDGLYINIHEAALVNYAAMHLDLDDESFTLTSHLTPNRNGEKVFMQTGNTTPWRTIIVSDDAREILASSMILNLNEPCAYEQTDWITPSKYIGVWWEYFTGGGSMWAYAGYQGVEVGKTDFTKLTPSGKHGANTEHVKDYIDFAAEHGFDGVLVEGWNEGWEDNHAYIKEKVYSFTKAYPDFDVEGLSKYAKEKGVRLIMHHETTSAVTDYENQMVDAFEFMNKYNYNTVKTGYVGRIIPRSEYHDGQWMVNHYIRVAETAADYKVMINSHEAVRPTGLHRTYPNWIAQESARGTEFESFNGNNPDHTTILPFTRQMGGPMDYTPGIFEGDLSVYGDNDAQLSTTLTKQLALYVTMYSPLQMAADLIENYKKYPEPFQFIKDVAVDWDESHILQAEPGDYLTIARKAKGKQEWFVGAITDENPRETTISLSFLPKGKKYIATIYADGKDAHWQTNPKSYKITEQKVTNLSKLKVQMAASGGVAISIKEAE